MKRISFILSVYVLTLGMASLATTDSAGQSDDSSALDAWTTWVFSSRWRLDATPSPIRTEISATFSTSNVGAIEDLLPISTRDPFLVMHLEIAEDSCVLLVLDAEGRLIASLHPCADIPSDVQTTARIKRAFPSRVFTCEWKYSTSGTTFSFTGLSKQENDKTRLNRTSDITRSPNTDSSDLLPFESMESSGQQFLGASLPNNDWSHIWGTTNTSYNDVVAYGVFAEGTSYVYVAGGANNRVHGQMYSGAGDAMLVRYSAGGVRDWTRMWGSDKIDYGRSIAVAMSGIYYVAGSTRGAFGGDPHQGSTSYNAFLSKLTEPQRIEVVSIATTTNSAYIPVGTTLGKNDFIIVTDPPGFSDWVQVAPLSFPTAGVMTIYASYSSSTATTHVIVWSPTHVVNLGALDNLLKVTLTNGAPPFTSVINRITFDQLVRMARAQGSPLDSLYDLDWNDWSNAVEVAKKARSRGILDVLQGMDWADIKARIFDPVHVVNGSFYADEVDLQLAVPDPLEIRRSYSSENQAPSDLGVGWQLSCNYFLFVNNPVFDLATHVDLPANAEVRVAEPDGTAVVYSRNASTPANMLLLNASRTASESNAPLNNMNANGIGARANLLNNRVEYIPSNRSFYVYNGQGSIRRFDWQEFGAANDPAYRKRPYLVYEQRPNGNRIRFTYTTHGLPATIRATDSTGETIFNTVSFQYHADNKLWQLTASDGRTVRYYYDDFGDLTRVVRPDETEINYGYEHLPLSETSTNYSTHRITRVQKPDNRLLENEYYQIGETVGGEILTNGHYLVGRVKLQKVTQTSPSALITNAWFSYFVGTHSGDPTAGSGYTEVLDALKNRTVYRFDTNRHITAIERYAKARDVNGNPILDGTHFTYTLFSTERRYWKGINLVRTALENTLSNVVFNWGATYDDRGNLLSEKITGNLSGTFSGTLKFDTNGLPLNGESAATLYTYTYNAANTNDAQNLLTSILRPNGSVLRFVYASASNSSMTARYLCQPDGDTNALNNPIYSREFYEYNANQVLTRRITDDGTASHGEFTNVS